VSVAFAVVGPKILGNATNDIFNGFISGTLPAGVTKDQVVAGMRANGQGQLADMVAAMDLTPGVGINFGALAGILIDYHGLSWSFAGAAIAVAMAASIAFGSQRVWRAAIERNRPRVDAPAR